MKPTFFALLALLYSGTGLASSNFVSNPYLPYPPGCAQMADRTGEQGPRPGAVKFYDVEVSMTDIQTGKLVPIRIEAYRSPCSEENRSLLWLAFTLDDPGAYEGATIELPAPVAETVAPDQRTMSLATEPNGWGHGNAADRSRAYLAAERTGLAGGYVPLDFERRWVFLLDNAPAEARSDGHPVMTASEYNAAFTLVLRDPPDDFFSPPFLRIPVPSTAELLPAELANLPFSGRQSGPWVIEGAADQGVQLAISGQVSPPSAEPAERPLVMFFSHYTFDADLRPVWIVGNAAFEPGATEVTVPALTLSGGQFRGSAPAERTVVGRVTLRSRSCNDVEFEFDYQALGLGAGTRRLQRLYSLETAGYDCRDYEAKVAANR